MIICYLFCTLVKNRWHPMNILFWLRVWSHNVCLRIMWNKTNLVLLNIKIILYKYTFFRYIIIAIVHFIGGINYSKLVLWILLFNNVRPRAWSGSLTFIKVTFWLRSYYTVVIKYIRIRYQFIAMRFILYVFFVFLLRILATRSMLSAKV